MPRSATAASRQSQAHLSWHSRSVCAMPVCVCSLPAEFLTWRGAFADDDDATQVTCVQDSRWRAGVNRQALPEAHQHQVNASWAAAQKRKEQAMSKDERKVKRAAHARAVRAEQAAAAAAVAAEAAAAAAAAAEAAAVNTATAAAAAAAAAAAPPTREQLNEWLRAEYDGEVSMCECEHDEWLEFSRIICKDYEVSSLDEIDKKQFEQHRFVYMFLRDWRATDEWMWWRTEHDDEPQVRLLRPSGPSLLLISVVAL